MTRSARPPNLSNSLRISVGAAAEDVFEEVRMMMTTSVCPCERVRQNEMLAAEVMQTCKCVYYGMIPHKTQSRVSLDPDQKKAEKIKKSA